MHLTYLDQIARVSTSIFQRRLSCHFGTNAFSLGIP